MEIMSGQKLIECPNKNCRTPFTASYIESTINFPDDISLIFDLIEYRFNVNKCPVCKEEILVQCDLFIIYTAKKKLILFIQLPEQKEETEGKLDKTYEIIHANDILEARELMIKWMYSSAEEISSELVKQKGKKFKIIINKLQLRLLLSGINGYLAMTMMDSDRKTIDLKSYYIDSVINILSSSYEDCLLEKNILLLYEKITQRILPECITVDVLESLFIKADQIKSVVNFAELASQFILEYIYAIASFHANIPSKRQNKFTNCVYLFWRSYQDSPKKRFNKHYLLNEEFGQNLLNHRYLFDLGLKIQPHYKEQLKNYSFLEKIMDYYNWGKEFRIAIQDRTRIKVKTEDIDKFAESEAFRIAELIPFNKGDETHRAINAIVRGEVTLAYKSKQPQVAQGIITKLLAVAGYEADKIACIDICIQAIKGCNDFRDYSFSDVLINLITNHYEDDFSKISDELRFDFLIEFGNTCRYQANYQEALEIYLVAKTLIETKEVHQTAENKSEAASVLKRNIAIVYRELGQFAESEKYFLDLLEFNSRDFGVTMNIVHLYLKINEYKKIISYLNPFNDSFEIREIDMVSSLTMQAIAYERLNNYPKAMELIQEALSKKEFLNEAQTVDLMNGALMISSNIQNEATILIEKTAHLLLVSLNEKKSIHPSYYTLALFLLRRYLLTNKKQESHDLVKLTGWENGMQGVWQYQFYLCWYFFEVQNYNLSAVHAKRLLSEIMIDTPNEKDAKYAVSWMDDKDELQHYMQNIMHQLFLKKLVTEKELLTIIEFSNAKELSIKLRPNEPHLDISELLLMLSKQYNNSIIIGFFETAAGVCFYFLNTAKEQIIISDDILFSLEEAQSTNIRTNNAYRDACPGMLEVTDKKLKPFHSILLKLSNIFQPWIGKETERVIIIPGRKLANLPLHLIPYDVSTLAENFPVIYINNLTTLVSLKITTTTHNRTLLVSVNRSDEGKEFIDHTRQICDYISELAISDGKVVVKLSETDATINTVKKELANTDEVVFLCHGAAGSVEDGKGICLSYKGKLPPSLLPVKDVPELKNFLLTWRDMNDIADSPTLMISIACSSAATVFGRGGINFGFEQALFVKGTSTIVSPLWDVDQESAVYWMKQFFEFRHNLGGSIEKAWQHAVSKTKETFPNEYFWAPFILKGTKF